MDKSGIEKNVAIAYHYPCYDGSYAALNTFKYYENFCHHKTKITFYPLNSNNRVSEVNCDNFKKVYILDKGLNEDDLNFIYERLTNNTNNLKFVVIDHHSSSIEFFIKHYQEMFNKLKNIKILFEPTGNNSACGFSFEYFKSKSLKNYPIEKVEEVFSDRYKLLNQYVEDSDTGKFVLKYSNEFKSGLSSHLTPLKSIADFKFGLKFLQMFYEVDTNSIIKQGEKQYKKYKKNSKNELAGKNCYIVELTNGNTTPPEKWRFIVCYTRNKQYRNHACPILSQISQAKGMDPIGAFVYHCEKNIYKMSMRTHSNGIDLGYICSQFGGGGHKSAAAFSHSQEFFDNIIVSKVDLYKVLQYYQ